MCILKPCLFIRYFSDPQPCDIFSAGADTFRMALAVIRFGVNVEVEFPAVSLHRPFLSYFLTHSVSLYFRLRGLAWLEGVLASGR